MRSLKNKKYYFLIIALSIFILKIYLKNNINANVFSWQLKNRFTHQNAASLSWSNLYVTNTHYYYRYYTANEYIEITFLSNHSTATGWGLSLYIDNIDINADPGYSGGDGRLSPILDEGFGILMPAKPYGLIYNHFDIKDKTMPVFWKIQPGTAISLPTGPTNEPETNQGNTVSVTGHIEVFIIGTVPDITWNYLSANDKFHDVLWDQAGIAWRRYFRHGTPKKAYVYFITSAWSLPRLGVKQYKTSGIKLREYTDKETPFLNHFYIYNNAWGEHTPQMNRGIPGYWDGNCSFTDDTSIFYSTNSSMKIIINGGTSYGSGMSWFEPDIATPSGPGVGYDITGAANLVFWIKGANNYTNNEIFALFGHTDDSCGEVKNIDNLGSERFDVTTSWEKHYIPLKGIDLTHVRILFSIGAGWISPNTTYTLYIDDIKYE